MIINPYAFGSGGVNFPFFVGASVGGGMAGAANTPWPAGHVANDLGILLVESANQAIATPSGWTQITDSPQFTGTAGAAGGVRHAVFYRFATSSSMPVAVVSDTGDHQHLQLLVFRNVNLTTPINATAGAVEATATTSYTLPAVTTTVDDCLVCFSLATDYDATTKAVFSGWTNANVTDLTERSDYSGLTNTGGGNGLATGKLAVAGSSGTTTVTSVASVTAASITFALAPL